MSAVTPEVPLKSDLTSSARVLIRFKRFRFQILDAQGQPLLNSEFATDSTGRGVCPLELEIGTTYTLQELFSPVANVALQNTSFPMEHANQQLQVANQVTAPNTPYGTA